MRPLRPRTARRIALPLLLLAAGCAGAGSPNVRARPYASLAPPLSITATWPTAEGQTLRLEVRSSQEGPRLVGARVFIGGEELRGNDGVFTLPYSRALITRNPEVRVIAPAGHRGPFWVGVSMSASFTGSCGKDEQGARAQVDLDGWAIVDVGVDRVYVEPPLTRADARHIEELLARGRVLLTDLTGVTPPPLAIGLMRDGAPARTAVPDDAGRSVWLERARASREERFVGLIIHEWTHAILDVVRYPDDPELRYVEDGLAELLATLGEREIFGRDDTASLQSRRAELDAFAGDTQVDLFAQARKFATTPQGANSLDEFLDSLCRPGASTGYAFGLAYWRHHTGGRVESIRALFEGLRTAPPADAAAVERALTNGGASPRSFSVSDARGWLAAPWAEHAEGAVSAAPL